MTVDGQFVAAKREHSTIDQILDFYADYKNRPLHKDFSRKSHKTVTLSHMVQSVPYETVYDELDSKITRLTHL